MLAALSSVAKVCMFFIDMGALLPAALLTFSTCVVAEPFFVCAFRFGGTFIIWVTFYLYETLYKLKAFLAAKPRAKLFLVELTFSFGSISLFGMKMGWCAKMSFSTPASVFRLLVGMRLTGFSL